METKQALTQREALSSVCVCGLGEATTAQGKKDTAATRLDLLETQHSNSIWM